MMSVTCPGCGIEVDVEMLISTVEGRKRLRLIFQQMDQRLKSRSPQQSLRSDVLSKVIARLARLREEACLSQALLARELGLSEWTVHRWESKGKGPGVNECVRWAKSLGTTLEAVLKEVEK